MPAAGCDHDLKYAGVLTVTQGEEVVKIVEAWRCRRCGATRVGLRGPGTITSTEGLLELLEPGEAKWIVMVWRGVSAVPPGATAVAARPGDVLRVETPHEGEDEFFVGPDFRLRRRIDGREPVSVRSFTLDEVLGGWIDLSEWPPRITLLRRQSG